MKMRTMIALAASLLLTACAAPAEDGEEAAPAADGEAPVSQEEADTVPEPRNLLPGLDVSGLETSMPEADFAAFQAYLPVLTGEATFRWVAGPYDGHPDGDWEPFDADMAAVYDRFWGHDDVEDPPGTLTLDRLAVADIVGRACRKPAFTWAPAERTSATTISCSSTTAVFGTNSWGKKSGTTAN